MKYGKLLALAPLFFAMCVTGCKKKTTPAPTPEPVSPYNEETSDGLVFERSLDAESFSVIDYVGDSNNVLIPALFEEKPVTGIKSYAFKEKNVLRISMPNTIKEIGDYAFVGNPDLNEIKVREQGETGLRLVEDSLYLDNNLAYVYPELTGQYDVIESVEGIIRGAFQMTHLTIFKLDADLLTDHFRTLFGPKMEDITDTVKEVIFTKGAIRANAFLNTPNISSVVMYNVTEIGNHAFYNCENLNSVLIPDTVTTIDDYAFASCAKLTEVRIGTTANPQLDKLGNFVFDGDRALRKYEDGIYAYLGNDKRQTFILQEVKNKFRDSYELDENTKFIASSAFVNCSDATQVNLMNVKSIGDKAFRNCSNLKYLSLPLDLKYLGERVVEGTKVLTGEGSGKQYGGAWCLTDTNNDAVAIVNCPNGTTVLTIGSATKWFDSYTFNKSSSQPSSLLNQSDAFTTVLGNKGLASSDKKVLYRILPVATYTLEDYVATQLEEIKPYACKDCVFDNIDCLLTDKLVKIDEGAFENFVCDDDLVRLPDSVRSLGDYAFDLGIYKKIWLNDGLEDIGANAFFAASSQDSDLYIPLSVLRVGSYVAESSNYTRLKVAASEAPSGWAEDWFGSFNELYIYYNALR